MSSGAESMIFNTGEPAYAVSRNGRILAWNDAAAEVFGFDRSTALGANCWELLRGQDVFGNRYCGAQCPLRDMAARREAIRRSRLRMRNASGTYAEFVSSTIAFYDHADGDFLIHLCHPEAMPADKTVAADSKRAADAAADVLTPRELEVLHTLADGRSTKEIATMLSISIPTVRNHIEHVLHKLHCHSRLEAVAVARRLDIV